VEADVGEVVASYRIDRRHDRDLVVARSVNGDEHRAPLGQVGERLLHTLVAYPAAVAELDRHRMRGQPFDDRVEIGQLVLAGRESGRELEQEGTQFARLVERLAGVLHLPDHLLLELGREPHTSARPDLHVVAKLGRELLELRRVPRQEAVELHVEDEVVGRDPRPAADGVALGDGVEARVHLHRAECLRVVGQAVLRGQPRRIPLLHEARVGPARCADEDLSGRHSPTVAK
jgi:hypothetical protein